MLVLEGILLSLCFICCYDTYENCYKKAYMKRVMEIDIDSIAPLNNTDTEEPCPICLEPLDTLRYKRRTVCGHTFCSECLCIWLEKKPVCPLCNEVF